MNINRLKDLREDKDLTQKEIADFLKVKQQQYSRYELGIRLIPIDKLDKLADFYGTNTDYLLGRTNVKTDMFENLTLRKDEVQEDVKTDEEQTANKKDKIKVNN